MRYRTFAYALFAFLFFVSSCADRSHTESVKVSENPLAAQRLEEIEKQFSGKIGVYALNTGNDERVAYHSDERFPLQSTIKLMGIAALLKQGSGNDGLLQEVIRYSQGDLSTWSPVTRINIASGMTLEALGEAAMTYSDNPAMNLVMKRLGGPASVTQFARSIGNRTYNAEHYEGELNSDPNSEIDTSTPRDMAITVERLMLGDGLIPSQQEKLVTWMRNNTTGYKRIRAGVPIGWAVADKTGTGDFGVVNDIGIVWSPSCKPIVLAIYTVQNQRDAGGRDDIVAAATRIVLDQFAKKDRCFG